MKKMLKKRFPDPSRFFPAGCSWKKELNWIAAGFTCSALYAFILYAIRYSSCREALYQDFSKKILYPGAVMDDFAVLIDGCMIGFFIIIAASIPWAVSHYYYHFRGSKSIYLMKRLPDPYDLWRRCLTVPAATALLAALTALLLTLILYGLYHLSVPSEVLRPGQWHQLWRGFL